MSPSTGTPCSVGATRPARSSNTPMMLTSRVASALSISLAAFSVAPTTTMLGVSRPARRHARTRSHAPAWARLRTPATPAPVTSASSARPAGEIQARTKAAAQPAAAAAHTRASCIQSGSRPLKA